MVHMLYMSTHSLYYYAFASMIHNTSDVSLSAAAIYYSHVHCNNKVCTNIIPINSVRTCT